LDENLNQFWSGNLLVLLWNGQRGIQGETIIGFGLGNLVWFGCLRYFHCGQSNSLVVFLHKRWRTETQKRGNTLWTF